MDEFEQLFGQAAPREEPHGVTVDVTGQDAAALESFCQALALMASGVGPASAELLRPGLQAIQSVLWQIQSGFGLAASGLGWVAGFTELPQIGQKLLSIKGSGHELHYQLDSAGRIFAGTWQRPTGADGPGALIFSLEVGAVGQEFHVHAPVELTVPLGVPVPGWVGAPPAAPPTTPQSMPPAAPPPAPQGAPPSWSLTVRNGAMAGKKIALAGKFRVGRGSQSDLALPDDAASRNHLAIDVSGAGCTVTDLGSTNGTFLNGTLVSQPTALKDGDVVLCGQTEMVIAGPAPAPAFHAQATVMLSREQVAQMAPPPAAAPEPPAGFCRHCGKPLVGAPKFCAFCGRQLRL